jgi:O-succinylbenzoic acid--CoA ligase
MADTPLDVDWIALAAAATPGATALVDDDGAQLSYADLDKLVGEACRRLSASGVEPGTIHLVAVDRVDRHLIAELWAAWRLGIPPLVIDPESPILYRSPELVEQWLALPAPSVHTVVLTSGSGGNPRPVRITRSNVAAAASAAIERLGNTAADRWLLTLPLFHIGGLSVLWRSAAVGGAVVLHSRFDAARSAAAMRSTEVTVASLVPTMLFRLLEHDPGPYRGMRAILLGGAAANRELVERGLEAGLPILQTYGMTETCSQAATVVPGEAAESLGSAGRPLSGVTITTGEAGVGEIVVAGPTVSPGYLGEPDRTGGYETGDIGYLDENGRLVVLGRIDDMIVTGGENVFPQRVADVLSGYRVGGSVEVVAVPDPEWGRVLVGIVVGDETSLEPLEEWARAQLARHEIPKHWIFVDELPMLSGGKVDKITLAALARSAN